MTYTYLVYTVVLYTKDTRQVIMFFVNFRILFKISKCPSIRKLIIIRYISWMILMMGLQSFYMSVIKLRGRWYFWAKEFFAILSYQDVFYLTNKIAFQFFDWFCLFLFLGTIGRCYARCCLYFSMIFIPNMEWPKCTNSMSLLSMHIY